MYGTPSAITAPWPGTLNSIPDIICTQGISLSGKCIPISGALKAPKIPFGSPGKPFGAIIYLFSPPAYRNKDYKSCSVPDPYWIDFNPWQHILLIPFEINNTIPFSYDLHFLRHGSFFYPDCFYSRLFTEASKLFFRLHQLVMASKKSFYYSKTLPGRDWF